MLAVDLDPQANLSDYLDVDPGRLARRSEMCLPAARSRSRPSTTASSLPTSGLAEAELMLGGKMGRELMLKKALRTLAGGTT